MPLEDENHLAMMCEDFARAATEVEWPHYLAEALSSCRRRLNTSARISTDKWAVALSAVLVAKSRFAEAPEQFLPPRLIDECFCAVVSALNRFGQEASRREQLDRDATVNTLRRIHILENASWAIAGAMDVDRAHRPQLMLDDRRPLPILKEPLPHANR